MRQRCNQGLWWQEGELSLTGTRGGCKQAPPTQCDQSGQDMPCSLAGMWHTCTFQPSRQIKCHSCAVLRGVSRITIWLISAAQYLLQCMMHIDAIARCLTSGKVRVSNSIPAALLERSHGRIIEASSHRVFQVIEDDGASDLLDAELTDLERIEKVNQDGRCL